MQEGGTAREAVIWSVGVTGAGMTSFCNLLAGEDVAPPACDLMSTDPPERVVAYHIKSSKSKVPISYIDAKGWDDNGDLQTFSKLLAAIRAKGYVNVVLMVINSRSDVRDLTSLFSAVDSLVQQYGDGLLGHLATVFTRCQSGDKRAKDAGELVDTLKSAIHTKYSLSSYLPTFFVDNFGPIDSEELNEELEQFERFVSNMTPYSLNVGGYAVN